jgi:hypothetical protein
MADLSAEDQDFLKKYIAETLQEMNGGQAAPPPAQSAPEPMKVNIAGQEYEFKDAAELGQKMTEFVHRAQQMAQPPAPQQIPQATVKGNDAPDFDYEHYSTLVTKDVPKGLEYGFKAAFGVDANQLKEKLAKIDELNNTLAVYQFRDRHPELAKMDPSAGQAIDHVRRTLNLPFNAEGLDAAYYYAQQRGMIKAPVQEIPQEKAPEQKTPAMLAPTPHISRSGDTNQGYGIDDMENMSIEQLERLIGKMAPR